MFCQTRVSSLVDHYIRASSRYRYSKEDEPPESLRGMITHGCGQKSRLHNLTNRITSIQDTFYFLYSGQVFFDLLKPREVHLTLKIRPLEDKPLQSCIHLNEFYKSDLSIYTRFLTGGCRSV